MELLLGNYEGFSRSYVLASEIVSYTDCKLDSETIYNCLEAYQSNKMLSIEEISNFGVFLKIAIINHIKRICEKIFSSQIQRFKVEAIIERTIDNKSPSERIFSNKVKTYNNFESELKYPFIEYMSYRLKKYGKKASNYQDVLSEEVSKLGLTVPEVIQKEHLYIADLKIIIGNCIKSLREINRINFNELLGDMNGTEEILNKDISGFYPKMDQDSKNYYKSVIEKLSKKTKISEVYIAEKIIELCKKNSEKNQSLESLCKKNNEKNNKNNNKENLEEIIKFKKTHVGYYLVDDGFNELKSLLINKKIKNISTKKISKLYISSIITITLLIDFWTTMLVHFKMQKLFLTIFYAIFLCVPISEIIIRIINYILSKLKTPKIIPKLDFENEIPDDKKTFVVIPTILKSSEKVKEMMHKLEVYYLANPQKNIYFALLRRC